MKLGRLAEAPGVRAGGKKGVLGSDSKVWGLSNRRGGAATGEVGRAGSRFGKRLGDRHFCLAMALGAQGEVGRRYKCESHLHTASMRSLSCVRS